MMPTALLICLENTFWNISGDGNFVELFKKSFTLYVESGMRKKIEAVLDDNIRYGDGGVTGEFKEKLCKIIMEHLLRKFRLFLFLFFNLHLIYLTTFSPKIQPALKIKFLSLNKRRKKSLLGCKIWYQKSVGSNGYDGSKIVVN